MAVPDYQRVMLPLMQLASDAREHSLRDVIDTLAQDFHLSQEQVQDLLTCITEHLKEDSNATDTSTGAT